MQELDKHDIHILTW